MADFQVVDAAPPTPPLAAPPPINRDDRNVEAGVHLERVPAVYTDRWGPFTISFMAASATKPYGSAEARCPFHCLNQRTRCKKFLTLQSDSDNHRLDVLWGLRHWCNTAERFQRQRDHLGRRHLQLVNLPTRDEIAAAKITREPPLVVITDADLDMREHVVAPPQAQPKRAASQGDPVPVAIPKAKPQAKSAARRSSNSSRSSSSSSTSDSSSTSL